MRHLVLVCLLTIPLLVWAQQNASTGTAPTAPTATSPATTGVTTPPNTLPGNSGTAINPLPSTTTSPMTTSTAPAPTTTTTNPGTVTTTNGLVNNGGFVTSGPATGSIVTTPIISLQPAPLAAGATNGPGAGATNSTMSIIPNSGSSAVTAIVPDNVANGTVGNSAVTPANANSTATAATAPDLAGFSNDGAQTEDNRSLAEVAASFRGRNVQTARVFTNADIARLNNQPLSGTNAMPNSEAMANNGAPMNNGATVNPFMPKTGTQQNQQNNPPAMANDTQQNSAQQNTQTTEETTATTPSVNGQTANQNEQSATQTDQNAQQQTPQQPNQAQKLPATASPLPLIALFGLIAGGAGAVYRFRRRTE